MRQPNILTISATKVLDVNDALETAFKEAPPNTAVMLFGSGDAHAAAELSRRKGRERAVGKWTEDDEKTLQAAVTSARSGLCFLWHNCN